MMKFEFVEKTKIDSVIALSDIEQNEAHVLDLFCEKEYEVLYVTDGEALYGVITASNVDQYFSGIDKDVLVNRRFHFVDRIEDDSQIQDFFVRFPRCHEVPVVKNNKWKGIIRDGTGKPKEEWEVIHGRMRNIRTYAGRFDELWSGIARIDQNWRKKHLLIYKRPVEQDINSCLTERDREILRSRTGRTCISLYPEVFGLDRENFLNDFRKLRFVNKNGYYIPVDMVSESFRIKDGHRMVPGVPEKADKKIYIFGPCTVFGAYVKDEETIEYYLQNMLNRSDIREYEIVNCGLLSPEYSLDVFFGTRIRFCDYAIIISPEDNYRFKEELSESYKGEATKRIRQLSNLPDHILDYIRHCDGVVNQKIAETIFEDLITALTNRIDDTDIVSGRNYFIAPEIPAYYKNHFERYKLKGKIGSSCGAIVMNCNPFTRGHRYLIEEAAKTVDCLIIFVVEEDKSEFPFRDRISLVKKGISDLANVVVIPSGKYVISKDTFAQYFEKDVVSDVETPEYDVRIFGEVVAPLCGINIRFVGTEPFDKVTLRYNETMKQILPEYGIQVEEIQRTKAGDTPISASLVRKHLADCNWKEITKLCPPSTVEYLKGVYKKETEDR